MRTTALAKSRARLRDVKLARAIALPIISLIRGRKDQVDGVRFLFYHDMRTGDRRAFETQLDRLRDVGDIISIDDAIAAITGGVAGRHICLTFDDGYRGAFENAFPILAERGIPAAFFVVSAWIDLHRTDVLDWDACRTLVSSGMTVGSHSRTHRRLAELPHAEAVREFSLSRGRIEWETGRPCDHFACPWGQPVVDYLPERDPGLAGAAGYRTFFTTLPHVAQSRDSVWELPRIQMEPDWGQAELRHAMARPAMPAAAR